MDTEDIRFGRFVLDTRPLHRKLLADGKPVELDTRAFNILEYLVRNHDRAVEPDEILHNVFGIAVSPSNVTVQISNIRRAFKRHGCEDGLIRTHKQPTAYQFAGEVDFPKALPLQSLPVDCGPAPVDGGKPSLTSPSPAWHKRQPTFGYAKFSLAGCAIALSVAGATAWRSHNASPDPPRLSIAVKPFRNLSADKDNDYLADAITDDLTAELGHIPLATVIARSSTDKFANASPKEIGAAMNVRYVIEGSVSPEEGQYHVVASLNDAVSAEEIWTANFDRPREHVSDVREGIVNHLIGPLGLKLDEIESARSVRDRPDRPDALDLYLRARSILDHTKSLAGFSSAQAQLEAAIKQQESSPELKAKLGWLLLKKVSLFDDPDDQKDFGEAKKAISDALSAAPESEVALEARANELRLDGNCAQATATASKILGSNQNDVDAIGVTAFCALSQLQFESAIASYERLLRLDPYGADSITRHLILGTALLVQGKADRAMTYLNSCSDQGQALDDVGPAEQCRWVQIATQAEIGDLAGARTSYDNYASHFANRTTWRIAAYYPLKWRTYKGFLDMMSSLHTAGMPVYSDEHHGALAPGFDCGSGDFAPTPSSLRGGDVIYTADVASRLKQASLPLVLDLGRGRVHLTPDQLTYDPTVTDLDAVDFSLEQIGKRLADHSSKPIIVLGDGVAGCTAYRVAARLIAQGFNSVAWYRGGEEAWSAREASQEVSALK